MSEQSILGTRIAWATDSGRRTGVVWSAGPLAGTAWVIPDQREHGEGHSVCVKINKDGGHIQRPADVTRSSARDQQWRLANRACRYTTGPSRSATDRGGRSITVGSYGYHDARGAADVRVRVAQPELAVA